MDVTRDIVLPLGRDEAWEVVCDPEAWLAEHADLELVPGAEGTLDERRTIVEEVSPGERLAFWWGDDDALLTRVELTLDDVRGRHPRHRRRVGARGRPGRAGPAQHAGARPTPDDAPTTCSTPSGDPTRREVLSLVAQGRARTATELAAALPVTRQAVSKHLAILEGAQLVDAERAGGACASTPPRSRSRTPWRGWPRSAASGTTARPAAGRGRRTRISLSNR